MKWLGFLMLAGLAALAAIWLVPYLPGYVLIRIGGWAVETSVVVLFGLVVVLYLLVQLFVWLWRMPGNVVRQYLEKRSRAQLELGMLALAEGEWNKAEKALRKSARRSKTPAVSYIAAAQAAHGPGARARRDEYLRRAEQDQEAGESVLVTRAQLLVADGDAKEALALLEQLPSRRSRPRALGLLAECYQHLGRWTELAALTPDLIRHEIIDSGQAERIERRAVRERLDSAEDFDALQVAWQALPRQRRKEPDIVTDYAAAAVRLGHGAEVVQSIERILARDWSDPLCALYGRIEGADSRQQLKAAESWLKNHEGSAELHLTLGRLCLANELWGKAREHLEKSLAIRETPEAFRVLGRLHERLQETEQAMAAYRRALSMIGR